MNPSVEPTLRISEDELGGDLPPVCARTGTPDGVPTPVWYASTPWWSAIPLAGLVVVVTASGFWTTGRFWWLLGGLAAPVLLSRAVTGQVPFSPELRRRMAELRRRRMRTVLSALLLTWVAVSLWLLESRVAAILVLGLVLVLYGLAVGMAVAVRMVGVGGRPEADGGATLTRVAPAFVEAVELRRTGHRP